MIEVEQRDEGLALHIDSTTHVVDWFWLRDHGEDAASVDAATGQRLTDTFSLAADPEPAELDAHADGLSVTWADGAKTAHSWSQLAEVVTRPHPAVGQGRAVTFPSDIELWRQPPDPEPASFSSLLDSDEALRTWLEGLHVWGFARAVDVPSGEQSVAAIADRIGYVRHTIFGGIWELVNEPAKHADSAYGTEALEPHTDSTYSMDAPGLQIWCFQERSDTGGESVVVDGFAAAADLSDEHQRVLASVNVPGRYLEDGVSLAAERPLLRLNSRGELIQVSFNNYDRAPFVIESDQRRFYEAYSAFHALVNNQQRWLSTRVEAGEMLAVDNWRALHGRRMFRGGRRALGAYLNHEDVESRRRVLQNA